MKTGRRACILILLAIAAMLAAVVGTHAEPIERVVNRILNGQMVNASVTIYGVVDKWELDKASNTIAYALRDDWGDEVTVISAGDHPETHKRYQVTGYVSYDQANREYIVMETARVAIEPPAPPPPPPAPTPPPPPPPATPNWLLIGLSAAVVLVLGLLVFVLVRTRSSAEPPSAFGSDAVVSVADKTQKITAAVADQKAVEAGTVKVMPGRFEVVGGTELKEIRLIRPQGQSGDRVEYTFGRLKGDRISHIQLDNNTVSRQQARLQYRNGKYILINIPDESSNPTIINGDKMEPYERRELVEGDQIQMGVVTLIYHEK